jgi:hypothetical protein
MTTPDCLVEGEALPRGAPRESLLLSAPFRLADGTAEGVLRVRNLSTSGLMADQAPALPIGAMVSLELRGIGHVDGQVVWTERGRVGIAFMTSVDPHRTRKPVAGTTRMGLRRG